MLLSTGRAPAGSPPQESNQQARRPVPASALPGGSSLTPSAVLGPTEWGARVLVPEFTGVTNGGGTGIPHVGCGLERWGRHVAPPPCSLLTRTSTSYAWPWALSPDSRKGSTGQVPCSDVLVEAAHLASSRPVLNRWSRTGVTGGSRLKSALLRDRHVGSVRDNLDKSAPSFRLLRRKNCVPIAPKFCALPIWGNRLEARALVSAALCLLTVRRRPAACGGPLWRLPPAQTESEFRE